MNNSLKSRAPQGGALGANGEWYEGGKFINTVAKNAKSIARAAKEATRKREIEPWVWDVPPVPGQSTLMSRLGVYAHFVNGVACTSALSPVTRQYYDATDEQIKIWVDAYNRGERWI